MLWWIILLEFREPLPGFIHQELVSCAGEVLNVSSSFAVDAIPRWFAHSQEVWPQAADGVLGYVSQGLASGGTEHVAPHRFVDTCHILGSKGLVLDAGHVNWEALATDELRESTMRRWFLATQWKNVWFLGHIAAVRTTIRVKGIMTPPSSW